MRTKNFLIILCFVISVSFIIIIFGQQRPESIQNFVSTTHQQIRNFQDNLREAETKTLVADEKLLNILGFDDHPRFFPKDVWRNTSLPVIVTSVHDGQESQIFSLQSNIAKFLPNNTLLVYDLGLGSYNLKSLLGYCNSSKCQVQTFQFSNFPSHITDEETHAYRPLIIQDALRLTGAILYIENHYRFSKHATTDLIMRTYEKSKSNGILAWPMASKNPVSSLTHKKMFEYFCTDAENFLFLPMVRADVLFIVNLEAIEKEVMLPWIQCSLTQDCIVPIGAQSGGCRFDKKPLYRYSGCHNYDVSALNIILGLKFELDNSAYTYEAKRELFEEFSLTKAILLLKEYEQNTTTSEVRYSNSES